MTSVLLFLIIPPTIILSLRKRFNVGLLLAVIISLDSWLLLYLGAREAYDVFYLSQ